jgi:carbamoyltransferase
MRIIGISVAHDSSIVVYSDGEIEFFLKEERVTKVKRDKNPFAAMLETAKFLENKTVDAIAISSPHDSVMDPYLEAIVDVARKMFKTNNIYKLFSVHHLCHASLAFYNSGFKKAIAVIVDRNGSNHPNSNGLLFESETIFTAEYPDVFTEIRKNYWSAAMGQNPDTIISNVLLNEKNNKPQCITTCNSLYGITKVYETATTLIGQNILENGKTMGLAAYGKENAIDIDLFLDDGTPNEGLFTHSSASNTGWFGASCKRYLPYAVKEVTKDNYQLYADYAYQVQKQTQEQVGNLIEWAVNKTGIKNVCVSGGYGLNVVANGYYISRFPDVDFFFEPLADDTGNSLGAAMLIYRQMTKNDSVSLIKTTSFNGYEPNIDLDILKKYPINHEHIEIKQVAELLVQNKKLAIFDGKAEGGPRALGNRSILFYPNLEDSKDIVNRIKKREWYRPFAACVLVEDASKYFDMMNVSESPYMTISFDCLKETRDLFPGIVHVDNSCRVQTVNEENKYLYDLLQEVKTITGHGLLLNTSFNLAGSPLVETISDAIEVLIDSELEYIWIPAKKIILHKKEA